MLQLVLDTIPVRVFWKDRNSVFLGCNRMFAADAGYSNPDDLIGKTDYDVPWREQADLYVADDRAVMESGIPKLHYEEPQTTPDGRHIWLRTSKIPLRDEAGNVIGVMGAYEDITERKQAEDALKESESFYRTLFDKSPLPLGMNTLGGKFVDVNRRFEEITGVSRDEAVGRTPAELGLVDQSVLDAITEEVQLTDTGVDHFEMTMHARDGKTRYVLLSTGLISVEREYLSLSMIDDITERKEAEDALRRSEEKYRDLVQNANSIILRWGRDGTVHFFNEFAQSFFGYTQDEIVGRNVIGTIVPETETSGRDLRTLMADILAHPERHETNVNENMRKNGERVWIAWTNKLVPGEHGEGAEILSVGLDITARKHAEEALQESEERYRSIFNSNVDAFLLFDTDGRIVDANERAAGLYGYSKTELVGLSGRDIVDPRFYHVFETLTHTAVGEWFSQESCDVRKDGTRFDVEIHGTRLRYSGTERLLGIIFDVTERNRTRDMMRLFTDVVHNMQVGLYIYKLEDLNDDRTLKLTATNPASTTDLGLEESGMVGRYIDEIFPLLRERGIPQRFAEVVRTGEPFKVADFPYSDDKLSARHFSFRVFALPNDQVGVLFEDISERVRVEEDKRRFYRKTIEAATEGKLMICDYDEIEQVTGPPIAEYEFTLSEDIGRIRHMVAEIAESEGMDEARMYDLILCVGEATTNAVKHADGGRFSLHKRDDSLLAKVSDSGPGIQEINLPDVALTRGYTTAVSLGMGYKAMISVADRVYLATGSRGTTVAVEMCLHQKPTPLVVAGLPDTWRS